MDALDPFRFNRAGASEPISTITGKPVPNLEKRFATAKSIGEFLMGAGEYLKGNVMGRQPEGRWLDTQNIGLSQRQTPAMDSRVSGKVEERLYAEPNTNWAMGEVDAFHGGGMFRKFSDKFMKTGTGGHVFGWGHYVSEEKGVAKYYRDLYGKEHRGMEYIGNKLSSQGQPFKLDEDMVTGLVDKADTRWRVEDSFDYLPLKTRNSLGKEIFRKFNEELSPLLRQGNQITHKEMQGLRYRLEDRVKMFDDSLHDVVAETAIDDLLSVTFQSGKSSAAQYKVKLFKGKDPSEYSFLDWDKPMDEGTLDKVAKQFKKEGVNPTGRDINMLLGGLWKSDRYPSLSYYKGKDFYEMLNKSFGSKEAASKFLNRAGIDGIRYPVGTLSGGSTQNLLIGGEKVPHKFRIRIKDWIEKNPGVPKDELINKLEAEANSIHQSYWDKFYTETLDFIKKTPGELEFSTPKNYVIFDPKNIDIMEGPGKNAKFNVGFRDRVKRDPEYVMNPAIKLPDGTIIEGDYAKGGHIEIANKLTPKQESMLDDAIDGAVTSSGNFIGKNLDVDFADIKGRDVSEIWDLLQ